jgi:hypothetical protein
MDGLVDARCNGALRRIKIFSLLGESADRTR